MTETPDAVKRAQRKLTWVLTWAVVMGMLAGGVAAGLSLLLENEYRAKAIMLVAPLPITTSNESESVSYLMPKPLSVQDYSLLLTNDEIVSALRDTMVKTMVQEGLPADDVAIEDVRKAMRVQTQVLKQTMSDVVYQPTVQLSFTATSPKVAAAVVNEWAVQGVKLAEELTTNRRQGLLEFLKAQSEEKSNQLDDAEKTLEALRKEADLQVMHERLAKFADQVVSYEIQLTNSETQIALTRAKLEQLQKRLAETPEKLSLRRSLPDEAYWLMQAQGKEPDNSKVLVTETINSIHVQLQKEEALLDAELQGLLSQRAAIEKELSALNPQVDALRAELAEKSLLEKAAEREISVLHGQYVSLAVNYGGAQIAEAQNVPDLKIASRAVPPEKKVGPFRSLIVLAAAFLGFVIPPLQFFTLRAFRILARHLVEGGDSGASAS